jgi:hypothetical protein
MRGGQEAIALPAHGLDILRQSYPFGVWLNQCYPYSFYEPRPRNILEEKPLGGRLFRAKIELAQ